MTPILKTTRASTSRFASVAALASAAIAVGAGTTALATLLMILMPVIAEAEPSEQPAVQLVRVQAQADRLSAALSRNIYRTEDYQANYDVQVPYQDTETYYEDVPYQTTEAYTDYESYQESENVCTDHTVYRQSCSTTQQCHEEHERECSSHQECDPQGVCHQQEECRPIGHQVCLPQQECSQIPDTIRECHQESVTRQRPVTRTRTVTKYQQEARTRQVTRYRTESRCCVTRQHDVYDHQVSASVELIFPSQALLDANDREVFSAEISQTGEIVVRAMKTIYTYTTMSTGSAGGAYSVVMTLVPTYQAADLGPSTITAITLTALGPKARFSMRDAGVVNKATTNYELQLLDNVSGVVIAQRQQASTGDQTVTWDLPISLSTSSAVHLKLAVAREGIVIAAPVMFMVDQLLTVTPEPKYDPKPFMDADQVGKFSLNGVKVSLQLQMKDLAPANELVTTQYHLKLYVPGKPSPRLLSEKTFRREDLAVGIGGSIQFSLSKDFGIEDLELQKLMSGKQLAVVGEIVRQGSRFPNGIVTIAKKVNLTVK
jgi:hypothetical protein